MLESIKVTERLHWPELELSKKYVLNPTDKPVSPSQVCLEKVSSSVLKDLFTTGTSSFNVLLQAEEEERQSPKHSSYRRAGRCVSMTGRNDNRRPSLNPLMLQSQGSGDTRLSHIFSPGSLYGGTKPASTITVLGSPIGLSPRPTTRTRKFCASSSRTKLPSLSKAGIPAERDNSTKKLCILTAIKPSNVEKEKAKFFKSGYTYNPQFEYSNPLSPLVLARHNNASDRFLAQIVVHMTDDLLSRASMTVVNSRPTLTINISTAREHWLEGMLRHEIGTHYFRGINNSQQPWSTSLGRKKFCLKPLNPTEEGLASIHSVLYRKDPTLWRAALLYYTVYQASTMSFSQLFSNLGRFVLDPGTRWDYCVRAKRGQTDTSQPGCFSKDQVYLDGILKILRHREKIDFPLLMALGKVSFEDVDRLKFLGQTEHVRIPHFLQDQVSYAEQLEKIMEVNRLTDEELRILL
ncbi:putative tyrosine carboxypeptidase MATCAP2 isoform X2 [Osmerus mordax]|uniref:putative tyrosine carboxypeptidase MATCAP2 isoform X2 n=1 Tax=Osmerus mordax TaxID=8014 RepID=UPI00350F2E59